MSREQEEKYRVRLDQKGNPKPLRLIREERVQRGTKTHAGSDVQGEEMFAQVLLQERGEIRGDREREEKRDALVCGFEDAIGLLEETERARTQVVAGYLDKLVEQGLPDVIIEKSLTAADELVMASSPIQTMANRPLTFLSHPFPVIDEEQWNEVQRLTEAAQGVYTHEPYDRGAFGDLIEIAFKLEARTLSRAIPQWLHDRAFKPETIISFFKALARIHAADCLYYGEMYFPGDADPRSFISNLALLYEQTAAQVRQNSANGKVEEDLGRVVTTLEDEVTILRVIQAQKFEFMKLDRPIGYHCILLPVAVAVSREMTNDRKNRVKIDSQEYARKIISAFRARRCSLTNEEIFAICSFLSGRVVLQELQPDQPWENRIPWKILDQIKRNLSEEERYRELQKSSSSTERRPTISRALARLNLETEMTVDLIPAILLEAKKMGYLQGITMDFYRNLGLTPGVWQNHQRELAQEKPPLEIKQRDIVVFLPLSGWCITEAHLRLGLASKSIGELLSEWLDIKAGRPVEKRGVKVIFTFGMFQPKAERGMPEVGVRAQLAEKALCHEPDIYAVPAGLIDDNQERSIRIQRLMELYSRQFGIAWAGPYNESSTQSECLPIIVGATEKLGKTFGGATPYRYVPQMASPTEDIAFLNQTAQIFALLRADIDRPREMAKLVNGLLASFRNEGAAVVMTHFPDLHSTQAAQTVADYYRTMAEGNYAMAETYQLAFRTMIPPAIFEEAWEMMRKRAMAEGKMPPDSVS